MYCSSCGVQLNDSARFCTQCGAATGGNGEILSPAPTTISPDRGESKKDIKHYSLPEEDYSRIVDKIRAWLQGENFEIQSFSQGDKKEVIQVRKKGKWRRFVGMSTALTIKTSYANQRLTVEVGQAHWAGKMATGTVSMFVLWPLAVTTAVGAYDQYKSPEKIFRFIDGITA